MLDYQTFSFKSYAWDGQNRRISLRYELRDSPTGLAPVQFEETIDFPMNRALTKGLSRTALDRALFALHLIGGISYYKTCCPKNMEILSGTLTREQTVFWKEVYENGLGEFFYKNNIDFRDLISFPATEDTALKTRKRRTTTYNPQPTNSHVLVPVGGGKDSVVTIELLKAASIPTTLFRMNDHPIVDALAKTAGLPMLTVKRTLSPALLELNAQGALNGHIPITAYLAFLTTTTQILYGFSATIFSNEASANIGSLMFFGKEINHQWSKSLACETMLQEYVKANIDPALRSFSLLRPLSELGVVKLFTLAPSYLKIATSCNANWKIAAERRAEKRFCGECPKCAFVFALYAAFLPKATLEEVFGKNLYADDALLPLYRQLLGLEGTKPFECVGTPEETQAAFLLAHERGDLEDSSAMNMFLQESLATIDDPQKLIRLALRPSPTHAIPPDFSTIVPDPSTL